MIRSGTTDAPLDLVRREIARAGRPVLLAALGRDGYRIPLPPAAATVDHHPIPVPEPRATLIGLVAAADRLEVVAIWERALATGTGAGVVHAITQPDRPLRLTIVDATADREVWLAVLADEDPDDDGAAARLGDISGEMAAYEALRQREQLFSRLADALPTGVVQIDRNGAVVFANRRLESVIGISAAELTLDRLLATIDPERHHLLRLALDRAVDHRQDDELEVDVTANGAVLRCAISIVSVIDHDGSPSALVCVNDITKSARLRDDLRASATFDLLTGCHNRGSVLAALDVALIDSSGATGVLFVDLDDFKPVNDRLGHAVGDELLVDF
jgi:PAS domain S-box-containing protein